MERLGFALLTLGAARTVQRFALRWRKDFPKSPYPVYFEMESHLKGHEDRWPLWRLGPLAEQARQLAEKLPPDENRDRLLSDIKNRLQQFQDLNPFASLFETFANQFGPDPDEFWEDEGERW